MNEIDDLYNSAKMKICSPDEGEPLIDPVTLRVASNVLVSNLERYVTACLVNHFVITIIVTIKQAVNQRVVIQI